MNHDPELPCALILAGGRATRMGGDDKGWQKLAGKPLIHHLLERITPQVSRVMISANRHLSQYQALAPTLPDPLPDFPGPLAGMLAGLQAVSCDWLLVVPCDTPYLPTDLVTRMLAARQPDTLVVVAHDGERPHPVVALLHRSLRDSLAAFLQQGERKIGLWYARHPMVYADFSDCPAAFDNLNTPDDLTRHASLSH